MMSPWTNVCSACLATPIGVRPRVLLTHVCARFNQNEHTIRCTYRSCNAVNAGITTSRVANLYVKSNVIVGGNQTFIYNSAMTLGYVPNTTGGQPSIYTAGYGYIFLELYRDLFR